MRALSLPSIDDLHDAALVAALRHKIDRKTVPQGALGRMAALAQRLGQILGTTEPHLAQPQLLVFAADHGIAARGVSAYPSDVTRQMVGNFLAGGALVSVLPRFVRPLPAYHLYYANRRYNSPGFRLIIDALRYRGQANKSLMRPTPSAT